MKKKLEAELISIAHRILKLKNKSELHQLHQEAQNLYEKLSVLRFVEDHFSDIKPTIGRAAIEDKIEAAFEVKEEQPDILCFLGPPLFYNLQNSQIAPVQSQYFDYF